MGTFGYFGPRKVGHFGLFLAAIEFIYGMTFLAVGGLYFDRVMVWDPRLEWIIRVALCSEDRTGDRYVLVVYLLCYWGFFAYHFCLCIFPIWDFLSVLGGKGVYFLHDSDLLLHPCTYIY